jgi:hypothetical protein
MSFDNEEVGEFVEIFTDDLRPPLGKLIVDTAVVLLVRVEFAEIHGLNKARTATKEGLDTAIFHCGNDLARQRTEIVLRPKILNHLLLEYLLFLHLLFLFVLRLLFELLQLRFYL